MRLFKNFCALSLGFLGPLAALAQGVSPSVGGLTASPTRLSPNSVFWNPASIGGAEDTELEANLALLGAWLIYDRDSGDGRLYDSSSTEIIAPNPFLSIASGFGTEDWRIGYATYFPTGAIADYQSDGSQRYDLISAMFLPWQHQFSLAYNPTPKLTLAAAFIYSLAFFRSELDIDMSPMFAKILDLPDEFREEPSLSSRVKIPTSTAHSFGGSFGLLYRPNIQWSLGLSILLPMRYVFQTEMMVGRASFFRGINVAADSAGYQESNAVRSQVEIETPAVIGAGLRYQPFGYWTGEYYGRYVLGSMTRFTTLKFQSSNIERLNQSQRLGAKASDSWLVGSNQSFSLWKNLQTGVTGSFHWNGVNDELLSTSRVDFDTLSVGIFGRYRWNTKLNLGIEYGHSFMFERTITNFTTPPTESMDIIVNPDANGRYRASMDKLAVSLHYAF
ncbi:MAG: hypothetical protein COV44_08255 [Deltaproteobacteria bacterium CG11_big_fil_rev_8_21_14_0_20_45_16]|nr:MAG: hypothetical protein COV44_08255 [Deltaproteobacteria bacterium CG11_big_fil_rev_8_21_14_0_20_45_16]